MYKECHAGRCTAPALFGIRMGCLKRGQPGRTVLSGPATAAASRPRWPSAAGFIQQEQHTETRAHLRGPCQWRRVQGRFLVAATKSPVGRHWQLVASIKVRRVRVAGRYVSYARGSCQAAVVAGYSEPRRSATRGQLPEALVKPPRTGPTGMQTLSNNPDDKVGRITVASERRRD